MINFLHTFQPQAILLSLGSINIYWYGLCIVLGIVLATILAVRLGKKIGIGQEEILDLAFWLVIGGILGARIYQIFLELEYYLADPIRMIKIWEGGIAIHGGIIGGLLVIFLFAKKYQINFWKLTGIIVPGMALAQSVGRWGNYFNQELFGQPTFLPWGIPINIIYRPENYLAEQYFHPTFLYESIGNFLIFLILIILFFWFIKKEKMQNRFLILTLIYLVLYSILRFFMETMRIDDTPILLGIRFPQIASIVLIILSIIGIIYSLKKNKHSTK